MLRSMFLFPAFLLGSAHTSAAQSIPTTIAAAEAEGAHYPRAATPSTVSWAFRSEFGGTAERRCVEVVPGGQTPGGSLRSGDFILRSGLLWSVQPQAGGKYKVLWLSLHTPAKSGDTLVVRGARIGHPADSIRLELLAAGTPGAPRSSTGFPSEVSFPKAGQWVVVATAASNWGCFLFPIASVQLDGTNGFPTGVPHRTP